MMYLSIKRIAFLSLLCTASLFAESFDPLITELIETKGTLVFSDDFNREEVDDSQEDVGEGWRTNSHIRAAGTKQADLRDGYLNIIKAAHATHGTVVRHDNPFDDGILMVKFRMHDPDGVGFLFNDPKCKVSSAGHICRFKVKPDVFDFRDGKMGQFNRAIRAEKEAGADKETIKQLMKGTRAFIGIDLQLEKWYELTVLIQGAKATAWIDGKKIGEFTSPGIDHSVKQNIELSVWGESADVDDLRIWSLD